MQRSRLREAVREGDAVAAGCGLALLVLMFAFDWYGVVGAPAGQRSGIDSAVSGWEQLTGLRWLMLLSALAALTAIALRLTQRSHGRKSETGLALLLLGGLTALLLGDRVLIDLPSPSTVVDIKLGAFLGLVSATGIPFGGYLALRSERAEVKASSRHLRSGAEAR